MSERIEKAKQAFIHRDFDGAVLEYNKALKELPENQLYVAQSNRGAALMNTGKIKEAIKCFKAALELNPHHYESMHNMGVAFAALKQFDKSLECFEKTLEYAPYFYASHCGKSEALASLNRFSEAADAAKDGITEDPNEPIAHADLAFAQLKLGQFEESVKSYERAVALNDRSPETARLHALALSELALAYERRADLPLAQEAYLRSIARSESPLALHNLAVLYMRASQPSKAKTAFGRALRLDPNFFPSNAALGVLHANEKLNDLALPFLQKANELDPAHAETLYNLGLVYMKERQSEAAMGCFKELLKQDPGNQDAKLAMQLLKTAAALEEQQAVQAAEQQPAPSRSHSRSSSRARRPSAAPEPPEQPQKSRSTSVSSSAAAAQKPAGSKKAASAMAKQMAKIKTFYTVEQLQTQPPPKGVDPTVKELYLDDQDFTELFGMTKAEWLGLSVWRQKELKKENRLF